MSEVTPDPTPPPPSGGGRIHWGGRGSAVLGALLLVALGFALVAQLRQNSEQGLSALRQSDLVRILDDVGDRRDRLHRRGRRLCLTDPQSTVRSAQVLDLVQELRDAGAEAIQIGSVRVVASTWFADAAGGVSVDGTALRPPYTVLAIGESQTMATALEIPGGVVASLPDRAAATVAAREQVEVTALHAVRAPRYARPAITATPSPS